MSQYTQPDVFGRSEEPPRPRSNPLAIVGLVLAFCISPIGLLLSLIALAWPPRVLAVIGVIIGLIGTALWVLLGAGAVLAWPLILQGNEVFEDYSEISRHVESHRAANNNELPGELGAAGVTGSTLVDPWGNAYIFEKSADGALWSIRTLGPDGQPDTPDDFSIEGGLSDEDKANRLSELVRRLTDQKIGSPARPRP